VINWATLAGALLVLAGLALATTAGFQLFFQLAGHTRLAERLVTLALLQGMILLLRLVMPAMGLALILGGWRLEGHLQIAVAVPWQPALFSKLWRECVAGTLRDLESWQQRRRG